MKCPKPLFAFMFILMLTCNLSAQEASPEKTDESKSAIADLLSDENQEQESSPEAEESATEESATEELAEDDAAEEDAAEDDAADEDAADEDEGSDEEVAVDDEGEAVQNEDPTDEYNNSPIVIRVNEAGEMVGQARASVSGNWMPVEANIALVSNGVLLNKIVADEDGSFAFPNISPGSYNVYGTASSYCGQRSVTVISDNGCCDSCSLGLTQDSNNACYSALTSAPAATFSEGIGFGGGFSAGAPIYSGGFAGGGGFAGAGAGGAAGGLSGLRLLAVGGIVTAIAVGDGDEDDEVSPSN